LPDGSSLLDLFFFFDLMLIFYLDFAIGRMGQQNRGGAFADSKLQ
jgi:hypothetical protein